MLYSKRFNSWPFYPLVGGHQQTFEFGSHFHHTKKGHQQNGQVPTNFLEGITKIGVNEPYKVNLHKQRFRWICGKTTKNVLQKQIPKNSHGMQIMYGQTTPRKEGGRLIPECGSSWGTGINASDASPAVKKSNPMEKWSHSPVSTGYSRILSPSIFTYSFDTTKQSKQDEYMELWGKNCSLFIGPQGFLKPAATCWKHLRMPT